MFNQSEWILINNKIYILNKIAVSRENKKNAFLFYKKKQTDFTRKNKQIALSIY